MDMTRTSRIVAVTAGLALTGIVVGAVLGGLIVTGFVIANDPHPTTAFDSFVLEIGAIFGAGVGVVFAPIAAWTLLRRIPLGRAIAEGAIGTALGAVVGGAIAFVGPILGGIGGFVLGVLRLRMVVQPRLARGQQAGESRIEAKLQAASDE
jgi:hypothetical protein